MTSIQATLWIEILKVRRSKMLLGTIVLFMFIPSMLGLMMFVQLHPEISGKLGMIGTKASMMRLGDPDWKNYLTFLIQVMAGLGMVGVGFVSSWIFGREFSERTVKDILVVPVSRSCIVLAKFIVSAIWSLILSIVYFASGLAVGFIIGLGNLSFELLLLFTVKYFVTSLLIIPLSPPVAFLAGYSRGYLLPLGFVILTLMLANFVGMVGLGPYFPWAIPGLYFISESTHEMQLTVSSYIILFFTGLGGLYGTIAFWRYADHK